MTPSQLYMNQLRIHDQGRVDRVNFEDREALMMNLWYTQENLQKSPIPRRAEVFADPAKPDSYRRPVHYSWSVYIPEWITLEQRNIFTDWHTQPDLWTPNVYEQNVGCNCCFFIDDGILNINIYHDENALGDPSKPSTTTTENVFRDDAKKYTGRWLDFRMDVIWDWSPATVAQGMCDVYLGTEQIVRYRGATAVLDEKGPYWKAGIYYPWGFDKPFPHKQIFIADMMRTWE